MVVQIAQGDPIWLIRLPAGDEVPAVVEFADEWVVMVELDADPRRRPPLPETTRVEVRTVDGEGFLSHVVGQTAVGAEMLVIAAPGVSERSWRQWRRTDFRTPVECLVLDKVLGLPREFSSRTIDLSAGGMHIVTGVKLAEGMLIDLRFEIPDGQGPIRAIGRVTHLTRPGDVAAGWGCGVAFVLVEENDRVRIANLAEMSGAT